MKLRAMPIMLSLLLTLAFLFGGWRAYQHFYVEQPIRAYIEEKEQVDLKSIQFLNDQVRAEIVFHDPETFAADYKEIKEYIANHTGKNVSLQLPIVQPSMKELWEEEYFIAEAMKKQEYSEIPRIMNKIKEERQMEKTVSRMDDENVYVFLQKGSDHLYAVLPFKEEVNSK